MAGGRLYALRPPVITVNWIRYELTKFEGAGREMTKAPLVLLAAMVKWAHNKRPDSKTNSNKQ